MAAAELRRFSLGISDFFLVNQREEAAADARIRRLDAELRLASARLELVAATVGEPALGLSLPAAPAPKTGRVAGIGRPSTDPRAG